MVEANRELFAELGNVDGVLALLGDQLENVGEKNTKLKDTTTIAVSSINAMSSAIRTLRSDADDTDKQLSALLSVIGSFASIVGGPTGQVLGHL